MQKAEKLERLLKAMGLDGGEAFYGFNGRVYPRSGIETHWNPFVNPADLVPVLQHILDSPTAIKDAFDARMVALCGDSATAGVYLAIAQPHGVASAALHVLEGK